MDKDFVLTQDKKEEFSDQVLISSPPLPESENENENVEEMSHPEVEEEKSPQMV